MKALQDAKKAPEYLSLARTLPGYGDVVFPHCGCDSRKEGHVIPAVGELLFFFLFLNVEAFNLESLVFTGLTKILNSITSGAGNM